MKKEKSAEWFAATQILFTRDEWEKKLEFEHQAKKQGLNLREAIKKAMWKSLDDDAKTRSKKNRSRSEAG